MCEFVTNNNSGERAQSINKNNNLLDVNNNESNNNLTTSAQRRARSRLSQIPKPYYGPNPQSPNNKEEIVITTPPISIASSDSTVSKRASSRLSQIPKPYYGPNPQSPTTPVAPPHNNNLLDVNINGSNNNLTTSAQRRARLRLSQIPKPYYGPNPQSPNNKEEIIITPPISIASLDSTVSKRASSRLSQIPKPYYGPNPQSPTTPVAPPHNNNLLDVNINGSNNNLTTSAQRRARLRLSQIPKPYYGPNPQSPNNKEEIIITPPPISIASPDSTVSKRASSRLTQIPKPYYGPNPQSPTTPVATPHNNNAVTTTTSAKKRTSSRLNEIPESKRPYYGPNPQSPSTPTNNKETQNNDVATTTSAKRRTSSRLSEIPESKRPYYGPDPQSPSTPPPPTNTATVETTISTETSNTTASADSTITTNQQQQSTLIGGFEYVPHSADDIAKVKSTLRIYNKHFLHFVQDENARLSVVKKFKSKRKDVGTKQVKRPDLIAATQMWNSNEILFPKKRLGHLPGIDVGYQFYSRAEMVAVGLHSHWLYGIDYMGKHYSKMEEFKGYKFPLAVAIVCSGQYEDDKDNREVIEYTGQGGNDFHGTKRQIKNQEMSPGNLALKNCMEQSIPVRFIRGIPGDRRFHSDNKRFKLYTYDGLYKVDSYQLDEGKSGFAVYKFRLKRLGGQPKLTSNKVEYNKHNVRRISSVPKLVSLDITGGQEKLPIPVINSIDDTTITGFTYTKSIQVPPGMKLPPNAAGCKCKGNCTNPKTCACAKLNGGDFPYVQDSGGRLIEAKDVVYECGPNCGCGPGCINRISQREIKYQLEVFRTSNRGWAVKTKDFIPSGAPICEYIGQLRRQSEMDKVDNNEYIFEIDCEQTIKEIGGRERRLGAVSGSVVGNKTENVAADEKESILSEPEFCIEAGSVGNVARFINHSCDPNLFVQCVVSSHHDLRLARIILVAADNIPPMQELTYDYGYALDSVVDENGNVQKLTCHCGTSLCRGRLY